MKKCNILFPREDPFIKDEHGCVLKEGHYGGHAFVNNFYGKISTIIWDYDWECGCEDCRTDSFNDMCIVYTETK